MLKEVLFMNKIQKNKCIRFLGRALVFVSNFAIAMVVGTLVTLLCEDTETKERNKQL